MRLGDSFCEKCLPPQTVVRTQGSEAEEITEHSGPLRGRPDVIIRLPHKPAVDKATLKD